MKTINEKIIAKKAVLEMAEYAISDLDWRFETVENGQKNLRDSIEENSGEVDEYQLIRKIELEAQEEFLNKLVKWIENYACN